MGLGRELLPKALHGVRPKSLPRDGSEEAYAFNDETQIVRKAVGDKYVEVEVPSKGYTGPGC